jgi:dihydrofolate reductase
LFSPTHLKDANWHSAKLSDRPLLEKVLELKQQSGKDISVGSRSLIIQLLNVNLIDEFQICVHPIIEGKGLRLFDQITDRNTIETDKDQDTKLWCDSFVL